MMADIDSVTKKFGDMIDGLEKKPDRIRARLGDTKGIVQVAGRTGYVHIHLENGQYYGVVFNAIAPLTNDLAVIVGYSHGQPELFQVLEASTSGFAGQSNAAALSVRDEESGVSVDHVTEIVFPTGSVRSVGPGVARITNEIGRVTTVDDAVATLYTITPPADGYAIVVGHIVAWEPGVGIEYVMYTMITVSNVDGDITIVNGNPQANVNCYDSGGGSAIIEVVGDDGHTYTWSLLSGMAIAG